MIPELIIAITLASEAIGEPLYGKQVVASVIVNRAQERKLSPAEVCLQRKQFSWWNGKTLQDAEAFAEKCRERSPEEWADCMELAVKIHNERFVPVAWVNHFYAPALCKPRWANKLKGVIKVGGHIFGRL
jgi:hypothetical protein